MKSREPERLRVVLDTSAFVAAFLSTSATSAKVVSSFLVEPLPEFDVARCRDPKDDKFLSLAGQVDAGYLISLDNDLLDLAKFGATVILQPGAFLARVAKPDRR